MNNSYERLTNYLIECNEDRISMSYSELEKIIGRTLPDFIYKNPNRFFYNNLELNSYCNNWIKAGYIAYPIKKNSTVVFVKGKESQHNAHSQSYQHKEKHQKNDKELQYKKIDIIDIFKYHKIVQESDNYGKENAIIHDVLNQFPKNDNLNVIAMKIAVIDVTNSTQISKYKKDVSLYDIAEIILNIKEFDKRVEDGDEELVNEIARGTKQKGKNLFSFASKYCCYHNYEIYGKNDYSIYDSIIKNNLPNYVDGITKKEIADCKENFNYKKFNDLIGNLIAYNNIKIPIRRQLDHYIWWNGKTLIN